MLDSREYIADSKKEKSPKTVEFQGFQVGTMLDKTTTHSVNIVALLAWSASQCSVLLPARTAALPVSDSAAVRAS